MQLLLSVKQFKCLLIACLKRFVGWTVETSYDKSTVARQSFSERSLSLKEL